MGVGGRFPPTTAGMREKRRWITAADWLAERRRMDPRLRPAGMTEKGE